MSEIGRFGVFLPSYIWAGDGAERARGIRRLRTHGRGPGLRLPVHHGPSPGREALLLRVLAGAAVGARRGRGGDRAGPPGTSILIMPLRNPVLLAKELATLQFLSENRMILGAGVGWNDAEYGAVGVSKSERGRRTDEMLDIMLPLLEGETVSYHGRYYSVDEVFIEPAAAQRPELWIGGGSQLADPKSPDLPRFVESVKARRPPLGRLDCPRPTCPPDDIARDWRELQDYYRAAGTGSPRMRRYARELPPSGADQRIPPGARGAAPGVPQGDERRAGARVPGVRVPVRHAGRDRRLAAGDGWTPGWSTSCSTR